MVNTKDEKLKLLYEKYVVENNVDGKFQEEDFAKDWREFLGGVKAENSFSVLREKILQFSFPVRQGISKEESYVNATKKGIIWAREYPNEFKDSIYVSLHETIVGAIPVIDVKNEDDFNKIICIMVNKNEPKDIPDSVGAMFLSGLIDWSRVELNKKRGMGFSEIKLDKNLYQDKFIILSRKNYSNVDGKQFGFDQKEWREISYKIRQGHEVFHYMVRRFYEKVENLIQEEILADCYGIYYATGNFESSWLLSFLGLESYPQYRQGGRLEYYLECSKFSEKELQQIYKEVRGAVLYLEKVIKESKDINVQKLLIDLCKCSINEMYSR